MKPTDLYRRIAKATYVTPDDAAEMIKMFVSICSEELKKGNEFIIPGLLTISQKKRAAIKEFRTVNKDGEITVIAKTPERFVLSAKISPLFKKRVFNGRINQPISSKT